MKAKRSLTIPVEEFEIDPQYIEDLLTKYILREFESYEVTRAYRERRMPALKALCAGLSGLLSKARQDCGVMFQARLEESRMNAILALPYRLDDAEMIQLAYHASKVAQYAVDSLRTLNKTRYGITIIETLLLAFGRQMNGLD